MESINQASAAKLGARPLGGTHAVNSRSEGGEIRDGSSVHDGQLGRRAAV